MKNRARSLLILLLGIILFLFLWRLKPACIFKELFAFPCPACGLTRAFECIFAFDIISSFHYNILAFPLFIFILICICFLIYDLITGKNIFFEKLNAFFSKYYLVIIILLLISLCINVYRSI